MTIRSDPPGALVYIGKQEIGRTPCSTSFVFYGKREFRLVKDGYETLTAGRWILPPWYEIPPLDFVAETVIPAELRDERFVDFKLLPLQAVPSQQLLSRAENLRQATRLESLAAPPLPPPRPPRRTFPFGFPWFGPPPTAGPTPQPNTQSIAPPTN